MSSNCFSSCNMQCFESFLPSLYLDYILYIFKFFFKDEGVGPRDVFIATETPSTCTTSGYTLHPVLGCIRYYTVNPKLTPPQWKAKCAGEGGKLILINSEKENQELVKLLGKSNITSLRYSFCNCVKFISTWKSRTFSVRV